MDNLLNEIRDWVDNHVYHLKKWYKKIKLSEWTLTLDQSGTGIVDASGNCTIRVYENITRRRLVVGRIVVLAVGVTPAAPHLAGGSEWAGIFSGAGANLLNMKDFIPTASGGQMFPQVAEYSGHNALRFGGNEDIYFELRGSTLTANTQIVVHAVGAMEPTDTDYDI